MRQESQRRAAIAAEMVEALETPGPGGTGNDDEDPEQPAGKTSKAPIGLQRTMAENALKLAKTKCEEADKAFADEMIETEQRFVEVYGEKLEDGPLASKEDLQKAITLGRTAVQTLMTTDLAPFARAIKDATSNKQLKDIMSQVSTATKGLTVNEDYKSAKQLITKTKRLLTAEVTKSSKRAKANGKWTGGRAGC